MDENKLPTPEDWFRMHGMRQNAMQKKVEQAINTYNDGLLNAATGSGKTLALAVPLLYSIAKNNEFKKGVSLLWISPLKALSEDIKKAIQEVVNVYFPKEYVATRNGDTSLTERNRILNKAPRVLVITPESLHLMLSSKKADSFFSSVRCIVVDEWHELFSSKRGVLVELALAYFKKRNLGLRTWGISATIGNLEKAAEVLLYHSQSFSVVKIESKPKVDFYTILPSSLHTLPHSGHLGLYALSQVAKVIKKSVSCLVFTNTRAQSEAWYRALVENYPEFAGLCALHHGSLNIEIRQWVEENLHANKLKFVVCTSSLDLGVDFSPVDTVIQIGSPKGVSRLMQRAGRSGHAPDKKSKLYFVPSHALELLEAVALQEAIFKNEAENREEQVPALDVLAQFMVTLSCGIGFTIPDLWNLARNTYTFAHITLAEFQEVLNFVTQGGHSLQAYPQYKKLQIKEGLYLVASSRIAMKHRLQIGVIFSVPSVVVKNAKGKRLGTVEEMFVSKLKEGDCFYFAGIVCSITRITATEVWIKTGVNATTIHTPSWLGGRLSFSSKISFFINLVLQNFDLLITKYKELQLILPYIQKQKEISYLPSTNYLLIEHITYKSQLHLFVYSFQGRKVNEGLAMLIAYRLGIIQQVSFSIAVNDFGFELRTHQSNKEFVLDNIGSVFDPLHAATDIEMAQNFMELCRKKFAEIASVAGLLNEEKSNKVVKNRSLQNSSSLLFKVFLENEPNHFLIKQAQLEVFGQSIELERLVLFLQIASVNQKVVELKEFSPFCLPLFAEGLRESMSNEDLDILLEKIMNSPIK
jgi:ATP-dependent helicase Lhr and Lhr-like helicase